MLVVELDKSYYSPDQFEHQRDQSQNKRHHGPQVKYR
ncbi:hypothetical protein EVA_08718 [gut metagenome]|uniref:Uncharacterized protein n=1 Tax=gut metagenome TaxID=749906 RepID=J9GSG7_9ZZZZ